MTFQELLDTITSSEPDDWHKIICGGAGPSYRDRLEFFSVYEGQSNTLFSDSHGVVVAYKPNLSITMAWGLTAHDDFQEPWANRFPDPKVSSHYVDVFYNNALVYRALYVAVDGARAYLPLPASRTDLTVPARYYSLVKLLDRIVLTASDYENYFKRAGMSVVERAWP